MIKSCYGRKYKEAGLRAHITFLTIKSIFNDVTLDALRFYFDEGKKISSSRLLLDHHEQNLRLLKTLEKFDFFTKDKRLQSAPFDQSNHEMHARILQTTTQKTTSQIVEEATQALKRSFQSSELTSLMSGMFQKEANKCWNYLFREIQQGLVCSFCSDDTEQIFYNIQDRKVDFTFKTCDYFIPNCLKTAVFMKRTENFFKNAFIVMISQKTKGSKTETTIRSFQNNFNDQDDTTKLVENCENRANCDGLCDNTIAFGQFSNEFIMGDIFLLNRASRFLEDLTFRRKDKNEWALTRPVDQTKNENVYNPRTGDLITMKWITDNLINIITKKTYDRELALKRDILQGGEDALNFEERAKIIRNFKTLGFQNMYFDQFFLAKIFNG